MIKVYAKPELRLLRMRKGFTQEQVAELVDYSIAAYGKLELRRNGISPKRTKLFLDLFKVQFDDIFELIDNRATLKVEDSGKSGGSN